MSIFTLLILATVKQNEVVSGVFYFLAEHNTRFYEILSAQNSVQYVHYRPTYRLHSLSIQNWSIHNTRPKGMLSALHSVTHSGEIQAQMPYTSTVTVCNPSRINWNSFVKHILYRQVYPHIIQYPSSLLCISRKVSANTKGVCLRSKFLISPVHAYVRVGS